MNDRTTAKIHIYKVDKESGKAAAQGDASLEGAVYGLYARNDIVHPDGATGVVFKAGDLVAEVSRSTTSAEQVIKQPFQLIKVSDNGDDTEAGLLAGAEFTAYLKSSLPVKADGSYDFDKATPVVIGENGATTITSDDKGHAVSIAIPYGTYVVVESKTPHNMKTTFEVKETAEIQKVSMKDEQAVGKIVIEKTDKVTGKPIDGVVFEVRDKDGKVLDTLTTDKNGHAESKALPICTYNEDGSFKEDIHYTVVETKAADGYILDETAHDVTLRYDDNAPDVVVTTLKLINVPTEPKLPQTGDNANPLLYLGIGALALITGVGVGLRGRKKKNKQ